MKLRRFGSGLGVLVGSQRLDGMGEVVNGVNKAINALPVDLVLRFLNLKPSLMQAEKVSVPSLLSLLTRLKRFCYYGCAFGDCRSNNFLT